jgi:hypothetical protein
LLPDADNQRVCLVLPPPYSLAGLGDSPLALFCLLEVPFGKFARISCEVLEVRALPIDLEDPQLDAIEVVQLVEPGKVVQGLVPRGVDRVGLGRGQPAVEGLEGGGGQRLVGWQGELEMEGLGTRVELLQVHTVMRA